VTDWRCSRENQTDGRDQALFWPSTLIKGKRAKTGVGHGCKFCPNAFGAAGCATAPRFDLGAMLKNVARGFIEDEKIKLSWNLSKRAALAKKPSQAC